MGSGAAPTADAGKPGGTGRGRTPTVGSIPCPRRQPCRLPQSCEALPRRRCSRSRSPAVAGRQARTSSLLGTYLLVTVFDLDERLRPSKVSVFIRDSDLERFDGTSWTAVDPDPEPESLPGTGRDLAAQSGLLLASDLPLGGLACYAAAAESGQRRRLGLRPRLPLVRLDRAPVSSTTTTTTRTRTSIPPALHLAGARGAIGRVVNVVSPPTVSRSRWAPSRFASSGERGPTSSAETPLTRVRGGGSPANYFSAGEATRSIHAACRSKYQALLAQLGLPLPRDHTSEGDTSGVGQGDGDVTQIRHFDDGESGWVQFPGFCGDCILPCPVRGDGAVRHVAGRAGEPSRSGTSATGHGHVAAELGRRSRKGQALATASALALLCAG